MPTVDETPRMTAAEADARFDALVADHRRKQATGKRGRSKPHGVDARPAAAGQAQTPTVRAASDGKTGTLVVVIVFSLGVACAAIWPGKPLTALLVGVPLLLIGRALLGRWRNDGRNTRRGLDD